MALIGAAVLTFLLGGAAALCASPFPRAPARIGAGAGLLGSALGFWPALRAALGGEPSLFRAAWNVPYGSLTLELDALSGFFLVPVLAIGALAAVYGAGYLASKDEGATRSMARGPHWFFYNMLLASMTVAILARNGVLFLVAWEALSISSFFLIVHDQERESAREAGWVYLVATHLGTAFLLALFALLGRGEASLDFDRFGASGGLPPAVASLCFCFALAGFGAKAGLVPFHVWLPDAHAAAPSHVSALLSAVMIKMGFYGLLRTLTLLGSPQAWWGWTLISMGGATAVIGILSALAQRDLKRLLAYSTVENAGIIASALGLGLLGLSHQRHGLAAVGFGAALLHVWNHSLMKSLLFLAAGSAILGSGTRELSRMGGLLRRMPLTGAMFAIGAAAIAGLPPLNGFAGELVVLYGAFSAALSADSSAAAGTLDLGVFSCALIAALALAAGAACAAFAMAFGIGFLGEARAPRAAEARESSALLLGPMAVLALGCVALGVAAPLVFGAIAPVVGIATGLGRSVIIASFLGPVSALSGVTSCALLLLGLVATLVCLRWALLARRRVDAGPTWDCGYARPTARMQYTASSFASPLTELFRALVRTRSSLSRPMASFPESTRLSVESNDICREGIYRPLFETLESILARFHWLQCGRVQVYVLYIAITILALLFWKLA